MDVGAEPEVEQAGTAAAPHLLATDLKLPAKLGQAFAKLAAEKAAERRKNQTAQKRKAEPRPARSATDVVRLDSADNRGVLVTIRSLDTAGREAVAAILYGREADRLVVALGVSETAEAARRDAEAAWRSR